MKKLLLALSLAAGTQIGMGATIFWTDWTAVTTGQVVGTITTPRATVNVIYSGNIFFAQTAGGTNYWIPPDPYLSPFVDNAPPDPDIIAIKGGLANTVTFSEPVLNPLLAIVSLNGPGFIFADDPALEVLSSGCGSQGCGTLQVVGGNQVSTVGGAEGNGVVRLNGAHASFAFDGGAEEWRGIQVGIIANPEPRTWALLLGGGIALLVFKRMRSA
ncbi:MAG: hypothetical protein WD696_20325 [Bryobacteraceae bacterium]